MLAVDPNRYPLVFVRSWHIPKVLLVESHGKPPSRKDSPANSTTPARNPSTKAVLTMSRAMRRDIPQCGQ
jgi:hypothetical protein